MMLIIDGHGTEYSENFDFKRSDATRVTLYSYTAAGISHQGISSIAVIKTATGGNVPIGYSEVKKSKIGGSLMKDRLLSALATADQPFDQFPGGFVDCTNQDYRVFIDAAKDITYFALALNSQVSILLSQVLAFYADKPLDVIWAPCRGGGGAADARYKKLLAMDPAKYQALFQKTYGKPNQP